MAKVAILAWFFLLQKCVDYLSVLIGFEENGKAIFMKSPRGRPAHFRPPALAIDVDGRTARLYTSPRRLFTRITSEFNSHLAVHNDQVAHTGTNFEALIHAQPPHLVYLSHIPSYRDQELLNRRLLR